MEDRQKGKRHIEDVGRGEETIESIRSGWDLEGFGWVEGLVEPLDSRGRLSL